MISGKALIIVERREDFHNHRMFGVDVKVLSGDRDGYEVHEDLYCCAESDPPCTNLKVGERAWCWVRWQLEYHVWEDWYSGGTEMDIIIDYPKIKVLKRQKPQKPRRVSDLRKWKLIQRAQSYKVTQQLVADAVYDYKGSSS